jgi:hypothetical protein
VFARIGCSDFAVPYDISKISVIADELETAWHRAILVLNRELRAIEAPTAGRVRSALIRQIRDEIKEIGPGDAMPAFDRETKQQ